MLSAWDKEDGMSKNIIICSDGTGNTFDADQTNVTRLIQHLALGNHREQVAVYDQGVGTNADRVSEVESFRAGLEGDAALHILPPPLRSRWPKSSLDRWRGLAFGDGLEQNIREMYGELSRLYEGPDDKVYCFCGDIGRGRKICFVVGSCRRQERSESGLSFYSPQVAIQQLEVAGLRWRHSRQRNGGDSFFHLQPTYIR